MDELGELGFWLAVGIIVAAKIIAGAFKEREKQALLRDLIDKKGESVSEVLAYLRDKEAAEAAHVRLMWGVPDVGKAAADAGSGGDKSRFIAGIMGFGVILAAIVGGIIAFAHLRAAQPPYVPLALMFVTWAAGFIIAWLIWRASGRRHNDSPPGG